MNTNGLLIVDDHPVYREALTEKLGADFAPLGVHVVGAASAQEGLDILSKDHLRWTVLLDIQMPGLSGLAVIKAFKSQAQVDHVVAISGLDEKLWEPRTVGAGATLFLSKNHTSQYIFRKLDLLIRGREAGHGAAEGSSSEPAFRLTERQREVLRQVVLAEVRGLEKLLQENDLRALRGRLPHHRLGPGDVLGGIRRAGELGRGNGDFHRGLRDVKSGETVNVDTALRVPAVLGCVRVIAEDAAKVPLGLYLHRAATTFHDCTRHLKVHRVQPD